MASNESDQTRLEAAQESPADVEAAATSEAKKRARSPRPRLAEQEGNGETFTVKTLRAGFQKPLKQFSKWLAGNNRYLDRDPLASWEPIDTSREETRPRRALLPEEIARALNAADWLDTIYN